MEQTSITKKLYLTLGFALLGAVSALAFPGEMTYETFAAPVNALGQALRGLSLSGTGGNIAAWAITLVVSLLPLLPFLLLPLTIGAAFAAPVEFLQAMVLGLVAWSSIPAFVYCTRRGNSEAVFAYTFAFYKLCFLFWLAPYCLISVRNSGWMTRGRSTRRRRPSQRRKLPSANRPAA